MSLEIHVDANSGYKANERPGNCQGPIWRRRWLNPKAELKSRVIPKNEQRLKESASLDVWEQTLGRFILNFGALENILAEFLKNNLDSSEKSESKDGISMIECSGWEQRLRAHDYPKEMRDEFTILVLRLKPIREFRNHIAHGHLLARWVVETETLEISVSLPQDVDRAYLPDTVHVAFEELFSNNNQLTELIEAFKGIAGFKPGWHA